MKSSCEAYHEKKFENYNFDWKIIYGIPHIAIYDTNVCIFRYKLQLMCYIFIKSYINLELSLALNVTSVNKLPPRSGSSLEAVEPHP